MENKIMFLCIVIILIFLLFTTKGTETIKKLIGIGSADTTTSKPVDPMHDGKVTAGSPIDPDVIKNGLNNA